MNFTNFQQSLSQDAPASDMPSALQALWHQANGDWDAAHKLAQSQSGPTGSWVHAYLHRVEGDIGNAAYWYRLAGKPDCTLKLNEEWEEIAKALILGE
jgi:hypothetical protein